MANKIVLKKSSVASKVPLAADLDYGELALNYTDGKLYFKNASNAIKSFTIDDSVVTLTGTQTLTNKTLTSPTINGGALSGTFSGAVSLSDTTASTSTTTGALKVAGGLGVAGAIYADQIRLTNNGNGTDVYIGDDVMLGDINSSNTLGIRGIQDASKGYIVFGNANSTNYIGRDGTNPITVTGQFGVNSGSVNGVAVTINGYAYKGGTGYHDFLSVTNAYASATNPNKYFRINNTGNLEIVNSAYTSNILTLTDTGVLMVPQIQASGSTGTSGQVLTSTGTGLQWTNAGSGSVTSVALSLPSIFTVSGSPVTTSGTLSATLASQTANTFLAAPNGSAGAPSFRTIVAADIPTLNQNTTGSAASVVGTVTGTNATDLVYGNMADNDQFRIRIGGTATNAGWVELATADDGTEPIYVRQYTGVFTTVARTATLLDGSGNTSFPGTVTANGVTLTGNTGTVTSVGGTGTVSGLTLTGTVTTSGNLTLGGTLSVTPSNFASQTANTVLAAPNGSAGTPTFRALVAADIPTLNQNTTGSAATLTTARTLTIGSTGKTFNGSADVSWSLAEIGALGASAKAADSELIDGIDSTRLVYGSSVSGSNNASATQNVYELAQYKSGFWDVSNGAWAPTTTGWYWGATFAHASNSASYNYSGQLAFLNGGGGDNVYARTIGGGTPSSWSKLLSSGNYTSYAVPYNYASTTNVSLTWGATAGQILRNENSELAIGLEDTSPFALYIQGRTSGNTARDIALNPLGGNIGIGTQAPITKLHVVQNTDGEIFRLQRGGGTNLPILRVNITESTGLVELEQTGANAGPLAIKVAGNETMRFSTSNNVGIGTNNPSYKLQVNGSFAATTKSFVIDHPTKEGKKLRYGSLEGPENGVYVRGKLKGSNVIELPEYWTKLVDPDSITVNLTCIGKYQKLYVMEIKDNKVYVGNENLWGTDFECFYTVYGERCDVEKLEVEID